MEQAKQQMANAEKTRGTRALWTTLLAFLCLSVFFYVSIIYKIIQYGP